MRTGAGLPIRHRPDSLSNTMARIFTLDEATGLLPRLREILEEMQEKGRTHDRLRSELASLSRTAAGNGHLVGVELRDKRRQAQALERRLTSLRNEITSIGCELKGLEQGLIDFPAEREGQSIYFCWRLGEDSITYWHDVEDGFSGRQPL